MTTTNKLLTLACVGLIIILLLALAEIASLLTIGVVYAAAQPVPYIKSVDLQLNLSDAMASYPAKVEKGHYDYLIDGKFAFDEIYLAHRSYVSRGRSVGFDDTFPPDLYPGLSAFWGSGLPERHHANEMLTSLMTSNSGNSFVYPIATNLTPPDPETNDAVIEGLYAVLAHRENLYDPMSPTVAIASISIGNKYGEYPLTNDLINEFRTYGGIVVMAQGNDRFVPGWRGMPESAVNVGYYSCKKTKCTIQSPPGTDYVIETAGDYYVPTATGLIDTVAEVYGSTSTGRSSHAAAVVAAGFIHLRNAFPDKSNTDLEAAVCKTATLPDIVKLAAVNKNFLPRCGIPNFYKAAALLDNPGYPYTAKSTIQGCGNGPRYSSTDIPEPFFEWPPTDPTYTYTCASWDKAIAYANAWTPAEPIIKNINGTAGCMAAHKYYRKPPVLKQQPTLTTDAVYSINTEYTQTITWIGTSCKRDHPDWFVGMVRGPFNGDGLYQEKLFSVRYTKLNQIYPCPESGSGDHFYPPLGVCINTYK